MQTQIRLARKARMLLEANMPWEATSVLEELAGEMSNLPKTGSELLNAEIRTLRLLTAQGLELSGKWRERVSPCGSAYDAAGALPKSGPEPGGQLPEGLMA